MVFLAYCVQDVDHGSEWCERECLPHGRGVLGRVRFSVSK